MKGTIKVEWKARWSGGMKEAAVLIRDGKVTPQDKFARHIQHVRGGSELYRADVDNEDTILLLYRSGSGATTTVEELTGDKERWENWDEAEQALGLTEGSLDTAFF